MIKKEFVAGRGYTKADWKAVDSPELSDTEIARGKPFAQALPELATKFDDVLKRAKV